MATAETQHLTREEQLALWIQEKKNKKKQPGTTTSTDRSRQSHASHKTPKASVTPRLSLATTSYSSIKPTTPHQSITKPSPATTGQPPLHPRLDVNVAPSRLPFSTLSTTINNQKKKPFVSTRSRRKHLYTSPSIGRLSLTEARPSLGKPVRLSAASIQDAHSSEQSGAIGLDVGDEEDEVTPAREHRMMGTHIECTDEDLVSPLSSHSNVFHAPPLEESPYRALSRMGGQFGIDDPTNDEKSVQPFDDEYLQEDTEELRKETDNEQRYVAQHHDGNRDGEEEKHSGISPAHESTSHDCSKTPSSGQFGWQDDSPEVIDPKNVTRKRRADALFLLLPKPSPLDTPPHQVEVPDPPMFLGAPSPRSAFNQISPSRQTKVLFDDEQGGSDAGTFLVEETVQLNGIAILEPVSENATPVEPADAPTIQKVAVSCSECKENAALLERIKTLMMEKKTLENRLANIRRAYEQRVTPFRDVFEESRKLQMENQKLLAEHRATQTSVTDLQTQMMMGLSAAVQKKQLLQGKLAEANVRNEELERELSTLRINQLDGHGNK
jgi:hypothetical protein